MHYKVKVINSKRTKADIPISKPIDETINKHLVRTYSIPNIKNK